MQDRSNVAPLSGTVVLDLTRWLAGPYCTMMLADAGATVIKIEPPAGGEITRALEPILHEADHEPVSSYFLRLNRRKKSVTLDLRNPDAKDAFRALVRKADVVVENFRPGVMDRLGLGQEALREINPRLVYCSISGFGGAESPLRAWPAFNLVAESMTGLVQHRPETGEPVALGPAIGDLVPSLHAVSGILMALLRRGLTNEGSYVDIAMFDSCASINELAIATTLMTGETFQYGRRINPNLAPYGLYQASDGYVCIAVASEEQWLRFCETIDAPDLAADPDLRSGAGRVDQFYSRIEPVMMAWLAVRTREEAAAAMAKAGVPSGPVLGAGEVLSTEQARAREMVEEVMAPDGRRWPLPASPVRVTPKPEIAPAETVTAGHDNAAVLGGIAGLDAAAIERATRAS